MKGPRLSDDIQPAARGTNWTIVWLIVGTIFVALIAAYFMRAGNSDQDKLTNAHVIDTMPSPVREKLCSSSATYNAIKSALIERAAAARSTDQTAFEKIAGYASLRMDNAVMESQDSSTGAVNCSATLSIDLPPGIAVSGPRRSLTANVDYSVSAGADGKSPTVLLRNADPIITPLATLAQLNASPVQLPDLPAGNESEPQTNRVAPLAQAVVPQAPAPLATQIHSQVARPSFDCSMAKSRGAIAVCNDAGLASLDRQMASDYSRAFARASPDEQDLLSDTARRFSEFRDRCETRACLEDSYSGRIREIRDIAEGRWQPQ